MRSYTLKLALALVMLTGFVGLITVNAQTDELRNNGVRAGYQVSTMVRDGSKPDTAQRLNTFYIGFYREQEISKVFTYGGGLEYFQTGQKFSKNNKRVIHNLSVPITVRAYIGPVFILGGIGMNFKIAERYLIDDQIIKPTDANKANWIDFPAYTGAGLKLSIFTVEARYHWGLVNVGNGLHNRYFQIGGAITF